MVVSRRLGIPGKISESCWDSAFYFVSFLWLILERGESELAGQGGDSTKSMEGEVNCTVQQDILLVREFSGSALVSLALDFGSCRAE